MNINPNHMLPQTMVKGDIIRLKSTDPGHNNGEKPYRVPENAAGNFAQVFTRALEKVNDQQVHADNLAQKMVIDPKSVNVHTVRIAMEKARMSLTFTKTVTDIMVKTYKELVNLR